MAILTLPATPRYRSARFGLQSNTLTHVSALDRTAQTLEFPGAHWMAEFALPAMHADGAEAEAWAAKLTELSGEAGRFYAGDPWRLVPRGSAAVTPGTPLVNGAAQAGKTLVIDGADPSAAGYLLAGDYAAVDLPSGGRSLHKMTAAVTTDGSGNATLTIMPPLRESPADGATILLAPATCVMKLIDDGQARWQVDEAGFYTIAFAAVESFNTG